MVICQTLRKLTSAGSIVAKICQNSAEVVPASAAGGEPRRPDSVLAQRGHQCRDVVRQDALETQRGAAQRMFEGQCCSVQGLSVERAKGIAGCRRQFGGAGLKSGAVSFVTEQRMSDGAHVDPNLVGATGLEGELQAGGDDCTIDREALLDPVVGHGMAPGLIRDDGNLATVVGTAPEGGVDLTLVALRCAPDDSRISAFEAAVGAVRRKLLRQALVSSIGLGNNQQARCIFVETMNDARALDAADARQAITDMCHQAMHQRTRGMARSRMDDETGRLVNDDQIVVLVDHRERHVLGDQRHVFGRRNGNGDVLATGQLDGGVVAHLAADADLSGAQQGLDPLTTEMVNRAGDKAIEPQTLALRRNNELNNRILIVGHMRYRCWQQTLPDPSRSARSARLRRPANEGTVMANPNAPPTATESGAGDQGPLSPAGVKALKFAVIFMGVLIVIGMIVVIGRVIYLASTPKASRTAAPKTNAAQFVDKASVALPSGTQARQVTLTGNRLLVQYDGGGRSGVVIVDLGTGQAVSHITFDTRSQ